VLSPEELEVVSLALRVALWSVLLSAIPGVLLGWVLARWDSPLRPLLHGLVMLPLVLPPVVTGYILLRGLGRSGPIGKAWEAISGGHIAYTTGACVIAAAVVGFPLLVESVRLSILGIDRRLELVSRSLGRGPVDTFLRVTLPLSAPGLFAGVVLSFARALGEFGATIVLAGNIEGETRQIPIAVYTLLNVPGGEAGAMRLAAVSVALSFGALILSATLSRRQARRSGR